MAKKLVEGTYTAKAVQGALGVTGTDNPQVAVEFKILDDDYKGASINWYGYFTDDTIERTIESLRNMGWEGDDVSNLAGITENEVRLVLKEDDYDGQTRLKVAWVNKSGGLALKIRMSDEQAKRFAAQMKKKIQNIKSDN